MTTSHPKLAIKRALISASYKEGLHNFATYLYHQGVDILSTGGTQKFLNACGIKTEAISDYTNYPEMMDGRIKTLHPKVHGALLGRRGIDDAIMKQHDIHPIDLIIVNLYPFKEVTADPRCTLQHAIDNIDIGGPSMIRSAAKNYTQVAVIVDDQDYAVVIEELTTTGQISMPTRLKLAQKAFAYTADYDAAIHHYLMHNTSGEKSTLSSEETSLFPQNLHLSFQKISPLRYGENPHQHAAFYAESKTKITTLITAKQQQGKALSFNNIMDANVALTCVQSFQEPTCVIVKHNNPCGVATHNTPLQAYQCAFTADPTSAFGGIIAFNQLLDAATATAIITQQFVEIIIAPDVSKEAQILLNQKPNIRVLSGPFVKNTDTALDYRRIAGGLLVQTHDTATPSFDAFTVVSARHPNDDEYRDLIFAWHVVKFVKSNAIVCAKNQQTLGIGAGQMSRIYSIKIAAMKAKDSHFSLNKAVLASDAFIPHRDNINFAAQQGICAIMQPGGSKKDQEMIQLVNQYDIAMVFTHTRHFSH